MIFNWCWDYIQTRYKANYVILEDSICLAHRERCGLPDIMDLTNGHVCIHKFLCMRNYGAMMQKRTSVELLSTGMSTAMNVSNLEF